MLKILIEDSEGKSKLAPIDPSSGDITIGRKEGNFIRLKERNVSRRHARIYAQGEGLYIEPVEARYGLKVNSKKITGPTPIQLGDDIRIGDYHLYIQDAESSNVRKEENLSVVDIEPQLQPRFVVISSNFAGREYHITKTKAVIGRNPECDIQITHLSVSGRQAEVSRNARGDFEIVDLQSSNGTKVNGMAIADKFKLSSGDAVTFGHVTMRYCGPGDFWSLNFGINDEPRRQNRLTLAIIAAAAFLIIVTCFILIYNSFQHKPEQPQLVQNTENQKEQSLKDLKTFTQDCLSAISDGDFEIAKIKCDEAAKISPNDDMLLKAQDKLNREISAKEQYNKIMANIEDENYRQAIDDIDLIESSTWAARKIERDDIRNTAIAGQEHIYYGIAKNAIDEGNIDVAKQAFDDLKKLKPTSKYLAELEPSLTTKKDKGSDSPSRRAVAAQAGTSKSETVKSGKSVKDYFTYKTAGSNSIDGKISLGMKILDENSGNTQFLCDLVTTLSLDKKKNNDNIKKVCKYIKTSAVASSCKTKCNGY